MREIADKKAATKGTRARDEGSVAATPPDTGAAIGGELGGDLSIWGSTCRSAVM